MKLPLPKNQFVRQVLGALGGSLVALALYQAYTFATPHLLALLPASAAQEPRQPKPEDQHNAKQEEIALRVQALLHRSDF
ncbi:MAG: hypothetical protein PHW10_01955 [Candidatus Peribacteraceae bacterium]|nr:hypothetical protein [Candidatus Peribacteraceae bacterium]